MPTPVAAEPAVKPGSILQPSPLQRGVEAAKKAVAEGAVPATLAEPVIAGDVTEVVIEDPVAPAPGPDGKPVAAKEPTEEEKVVELETGAEPGEEQPGEPIIVALPELRQGQEPIELEVEDQETADAIAALVRGNARRDQYNRAMGDLNKQREEFQQFEDMLTIDPVNFMVDRVRPDLQVEVALHLLSLPGVYDKVAEKYVGPAGEELDREKVGLRLQADRVGRQQQSSQEVQARSYARAQGRIVADTIERMIPDDFSDADASGLRDDLLRDIRDHVEQSGATSLRPEELPFILQRRLEQYGIEAASALSGSAPAPLRSRAPAPAAARETPGAPARSTGQRFVEGARRREAASKVPGTGAGAPPTRITLPAGQKIGDRVNSLMKLFGVLKR
jgi:hypothetical protein